MRKGPEKQFGTVAWSSDAEITWNRTFGKNMKTAVLLIGYGGPTSKAEVLPFFQHVLEGVKIPQSRFDEVLRHYDRFDGVSPYNANTYMQKEGLERWFEAKGLPIPVYVGFLYASPNFQNIFEDLKRDGIEKVAGFVLSSFHCYVSFDKYIKKLKIARAAADASSILIEFSENFSKDPLFLEAQRERVKQVLNQTGSPEIEKTFFLFSAHSVPVPMSNKYGYARQFTEASTLIAKDLGLLHWGCGYQSRSGNPGDAWLSPDVRQTIRRLDRAQIKNVMVIPIGFLCDHMEILYDLDVDARRCAEDLGLKYFRSPTVGDHPKFIELIGNQVLKEQ